MDNFVNINIERVNYLDNRVKLIRKKLNISQADFGNKLGITGAGISKIENGKRNLTEQMLRMICKEFNINEKWLRSGEGEVFRQLPSEAIGRLADNYRLDELDKRIISEYVRLDEKKRQVIKEYIMRVAYGSNISDILTDKNPVIYPEQVAEEKRIYESL